MTLPTPQPYNKYITRTISEIYKASKVSRWHTHNTIKVESLAEHHAIVAQLLVSLFPSVSREALVYALFHDVGEWSTGDVPATTKTKLGLRQVLDKEESKHNHFSSYRSVLEPHEIIQVDLCDVLARVIFLYKEHELGNRSVEPMITNSLVSITEHISALSRLNVPIENYTAILNLFTCHTEFYRRMYNEDN